MKSIKSVIEKIRGFKRDKDAPRGNFNASSIDRTMGCPGSVKQCEDIPAISTTYSNEGQLAHAVCEAVYNYEVHGIPYSDELRNELANQVDFGDEMEGYAHDYFGIIDKVDRLVGNIHFTEVEQYLFIDDVRGPDRLSGMADYLVIGDKGAVVLDYKYGKNVVVDITHPQLLTYVTALRDIDVPNYEFHVAVHQPRIDGETFKIHTYKREDLLNHYDKLVKMRKDSKAKDAKLILGKHCRWCPASRTKDIDHKCPAKDNEDVGRMTDSMRDVFAIAKSAELNIWPKDMQIQDFFQKLVLVKKYEKIFMEEIEGRLEKGKLVKGFKLVERKGRRAWNGTPEELSTKLVDRFPKLERRGVTVEKMKGITEIEKIIGKGKLEDFTKVSNKKVVEFEEVDIDDLFSRRELEVKYRNKED